MDVSLLLLGQQKAYIHEDHLGQDEAAAPRAPAARQRAARG
jgi:hypothetical protein